ncbi:hypothetical protein BO221_15545 [Archangium sp. Cb G35]|nr:hypothetical protein BO221_15545 [Archangium sp. Cb G35]
MVKTSAEAAGANCATGGLKLEAGVDADSNGTLDAAEVDWALTRYVCNGAQGIQGVPGAKGDPGTKGDKGDKGDTGATGAAGARALVKTSAEAVGANCATGGVKLEAGVDTNGNGTLDTAEVDAALTRYVCTGAQGPQGIPGNKGDTGATGAAGARALVKTSAEAAGANCATGGVKLEAGVDANGNSTLDTAEVDAALTRYVCNGPKGDTGTAGGAGPQGPSGAVGLYGDGSAGVLNLLNGQTLDLTTAADLARLPAGLNTQFSTITISGELTVPSGTLLRASGDITVNGTGKIVVKPGVEDTGNGEAPQGVARTPASTYSGGQAITGLQAAQVLRPQVAGGGAGARIYAGDGANGGAGGGSLIIASGGSVRIITGASITANGQNGTNPMTAGASILGTGGGAGGVVVVAAKGAITLAGTIQANGGNGADGFNGNGGTGEGGGGGGGGGIIHLLSSSAATTTGSTVVNGGTAGDNAAPTTGTSVTTAGGGGACGGNGGNGGGFIPGTATIVSATAGQAGQVLKTVAPAPENLLLR